MAHKRKTETDKKSIPYKIEDAMKVTDDIFGLNKQNEYNPGAFIHGLVFALEVTQQSYNIPHQQLADLKRGCRKYFKEVANNKKIDSQP